MSALLKRNRARFDDEDGDDQLDERNRCRFCNKFFVRLGLHLRSCRQDNDRSQILKDARQALAGRQSARKRPKPARSSSPQETAAQSVVFEGPGQRSRIETANDIEVRPKISQKGALIDAM
jgi:hypothetical protein